MGCCRWVVVESQAAAEIGNHHRSKNRPECWPELAGLSGLCIPDSNCFAEYLAGGTAVAVAAEAALAIAIVPDIRIVRLEADSGFVEVRHLLDIGLSHWVCPAREPS